ncbi:unnamed protein product [Ostreobium quekettii]|uniref:F-box domain-containing protein n=1 Tax=Ostreobium quekettii TaxID=121088 RepID=A0A8S1J663_9CHLO|nr:unnamed protein product [Ostreobium quekettii]|eukprot:evm.model.scf_761.3 EVM.evm.TU.scf_761.3   scf_761:30261-32938(-)
MAEPQCQAGLHDLPDACLEAVLDFLPAGDLLAFQLTCRRFRDAGRSPTVWIRKLRSDYGLRLGRAAGGGSLGPQRLYVSLARQRRRSRLRFRGLLTDGGVDAGQAYFWCSNMFETDSRRCYSSEMCSNCGVRVMAGLCPDVPAPRLPRQPIRAHHRLDLASWRNDSDNADADSPPVIYDRCVAQRLALADPDVTGVAQSVVVSREGPLSCPVRCGAIFLANRTHGPDNGAAGEDFARGLYEAARGRFVDEMAKARSLEALMEACEAGRLPRAAGRQRSTHGEWVQFEDVEDAGLGEMCPLVWFRFFSREEARLARRAALERRGGSIGNQAPMSAADPVPLDIIPDLSALWLPSGGMPEPHAYLPGPSEPPQAADQLQGVDLSPEPPGGNPTDQEGPSAAGHLAGVDFPVESLPVEGLGIMGDAHDAIVGDLGAPTGQGGGPGTPEGLEAFLEEEDDATSVDGGLVALWPGQEMHDGQSDNEWNLADEYVFPGLFGGWNPQFLFKTLEGEEAGTSGRDKLVIKLTKPASGNLMCVLLIDSENLMAEYMDNHEVPNIDINCVHVKGLETAIPGDLRLLA